MWGRDRRNNSVQDEEQGYLVSVSDLMAGLLFIFVITLSVYALNFKFAETSQKVAEAKHREEKVKLERIVDQLTGTKRRRAQMLHRIQAEARKYGLNISVNEEQGILHLQEGILFDSGSAAIKHEGQEKLKVLAKIFLEVLPEYLCSALPSESSERSIAKVGTIETVFIEGHTDRQPVRPGARFKDNLELSTARARNTFKFLAKNAPQLIGLRNCDGHYIFSLSGYGEYRPIKPYEEGVFNVPQNRRIDFRFIMFPPEGEPELLKELEKKLTNSEGVCN